MYTIISTIVNFLLSKLPCQWTTDSHEVDCCAINRFFGVMYRSAFVMEMEEFEIYLPGLAICASLTEGEKRVWLRRRQAYETWIYTR